MEKDPENNPNSADKDYGFPFVKVDALQNPLQNEAPAHSKDVKEKFEEELETKAENKSQPKSIKFDSKEKTEKKKKSQVPLLFSLVFLIVIVLASMAYFLYFLPNQKEEIQIAQSSEEQTEEPQILSENIEPEETFGTKSDSLPLEVVETPAVEVPAPANSSLIGKLIVLDAKEAVSSYHLVVASLPNERIAREEAQVFLDKGKDIWLIFPSGDTKNYRLSVGKYGSFTAATEALAAAKADYNESTWILKY
jgi:cytoskeletal protein RodZ